MTYSKLSMTKTAGWATNHVIDDVVNNARWGFTKAAFKKAVVTDYDAKLIREAARQDGCDVPEGLDA